MIVLLFDFTCILFLHLFVSLFHHKPLWWYINIFCMYACICMYVSSHLHWEVKYPTAENLHHTSKSLNLKPFVNTRLSLTFLLYCTLNAWNKYLENEPHWNKLTKYLSSSPEYSQNRYFLYNEIICYYKIVNLLYYTIIWSLRYLSFLFTFSMGAVFPCVSYALHLEVAQLPAGTAAVPHVPTRVEVQGVKGERTSGLTFHLWTCWKGKASIFHFAKGTCIRTT